MSEPTFSEIIFSLPFVLFALSIAIMGLGIIWAAIFATRLVLWILT